MQLSEAQQELIRFWKKMHPSESEVAAAWERRTFQNESLRTVDGKILQVVFPGRKSGLRGPDFSDALIVIDGCLERGSVEIHVRSSDFGRHGHGVDHHYDKLILHVVLIHDTDEMRLNGKVPVLELGRLLEALPDLASDPPGGTTLPCTNVADQMGVKRLVYHLDEAGKVRFKLRRADF